LCYENVSLGSRPPMDLSEGASLPKYVFSEASQTAFVYFSLLPYPVRMRLNQPH